MQPVFYAAEINKEFVIKMTNSPTVRRWLNNTRSMPRVVIPLHLARVGIPAHRAKNSNIAKLQTGLRSPAGPRRRRKRTHAIGVHSLPPAVLSVTISLAAQDCAVAGGGKAPVSACKPLCAIFLKAEGVPAFICESERGPFVGEVEKRLGTAL